MSSKGTLTGGYFKNVRSKLEIQKQRNEFMEQIKDTEEQLTQLREQLREIEAKINLVVSDMQKTETKNSKAKYGLKPLIIKISIIKIEF